MTFRPICLETFLGGMETEEVPDNLQRQRRPLKPSLVEWKLADLAGYCGMGCSLETFLGGMETDGEAAQVLQHGNLETFLGGMETKLCVLNPRRDGALKPSLVEWKRAKAALEQARSEP